MFVSLIMRRLVMKYLVLMMNCHMIYQKDGLGVNCSNAVSKKSSEVVLQSMRKRGRFFRLHKNAIKRTGASISDWLYGSMMPLSEDTVKKSTCAMETSLSIQPVQERLGVSASIIASTTPAPFQ